MGFQKSVNLYNASAVSGDMATPDQAIYQAVNFTAEEDLEVGKFAFAGTDPAVQAKATGEVLLGFIQRIINYNNYDLTSSGSMTIKAGSTVTIAVRGDFWLRNPGNLSHHAGQPVWVKKETGEIGIGGPKDDTWIDTGFKVKTASNPGEMMIISNWNL